MISTCGRKQQNRKLFLPIRLSGKWFLWEINQTESEIDDIIENLLFPLAAHLARIGCTQMKLQILEQNTTDNERREVDNVVATL